MNIATINPNIALNERRRALRNIAATTPDRLSPHYRERDFGIGYGNSSGYARSTTYTANTSRPLFRVG